MYVLPNKSINADIEINAIFLRRPEGLYIYLSFDNMVHYSKEPRFIDSFEQI